MEIGGGENQNHKKAACYGIFPKMVCTCMHAAPGIGCALEEAKRTEGLGWEPSLGDIGL